MYITRRKVLLTIAQLAASAALAGCGKSRPEPDAGHENVELLASVAYDILPFPELPPALYVTAANRVLEAGGIDVAHGLEALRKASQGVTWKDLDEAKRVDVLQSLQTTPFFLALRTTTIQVVLRDPAGQAIAGYGGSAIQHGGYIRRGFDDIAWLPAAQKY